MEGENEVPGGPSLSIQMRLAGHRGVEADDALRRHFQLSDGSLVTVKEDPLLVSIPDCFKRVAARLEWREYDVLLRERLWREGDDDVIVINVPFAELQRHGEVVQQDWLDCWVEACQAVHAHVPIRAAVIGEELNVAAMLLDFWESPSVRGDLASKPGALWPTEDGLHWTPIDYAIPTND